MGGEAGELVLLEREVPVPPAEPTRLDETLLVGGRLYQGRLDSDAITKLVDSLAR